MKRKRQWPGRSLRLEISKNKNRFDAKLFRKGHLFCWEDGTSVRDAIMALRKVWLRSKLWDPTIEEEDENGKTKVVGGWIPLINYPTAERIKEPVVCWRCGYGAIFVLAQPESRCCDNGGVSHFACIAETYDQKIRVKGEDGKMVTIDRPGARGLTERWIKEPLDKISTP